MLPEESFVARYVHEGNILPGRQRGPGVAQVNGQPAAPFFLPAVRLHAGKRAHQRALAAIDVSGGGNDMHGSARPACIRIREGRQRLAHRVEYPVIVLFGHAAQIEQAGAVVDAREHGRVAGTQGAGERFGEPERPPLQGDTGCSAAADPAVVRDDRYPEGRGEPVGTVPQPLRVGVQGPDNRRCFARDRRLQRREGKFVGPYRSGERVACQPGDDLRPAEQQTRLGSAQQFVTAGDDDVGPAGQRGGSVRFFGKVRIGRQQSTARDRPRGQPRARRPAGSVRPMEQRR